MSDITAISGAPIFDGQQWHDDAALLIEMGQVSAIVPAANIPASARSVVVAGGMIVPGFVDLQVNGGGGVLFNNDPTVQSIRTICSAHAPFGTTALLPTLITDTVAVNVAAMEAGIEASAEGVPGFLGLHLEGPHLSVARKGTHDPKLIRVMEADDFDRLIKLRGQLPNLLVTVAAETVTPDQIARLTAAGIVVSIGHSDADAQTTAAAVASGANMATHLFNAMSQIGNREPGVVGAVLNAGTVYAGLIADGIHVHPQTIALALRAKVGEGKLFLVTDAMSQTGTDINTLVLNGRTITRADGALRLSDGTLAGADLTMIDAVNYMIDTIGLSVDEALRMAALYPAQAMGINALYGHLGVGAVASFVVLDDARQVQQTWIAGQQLYAA